MKKIRIAVIAGGPSSEREVSLRSGQQILEKLDSARYERTLIEIGKDGTWRLGAGMQRSSNKALVQPTAPTLSRSNLQAVCDVAFIALHGTYGEDGRVQAILDLLGFTYTGSNVLASALGMNKAFAARLVQNTGQTCPKSVLVHPDTSDSSIAKVATDLGLPCVVKPNESGSSVGISIVNTSIDLTAAVRKARAESTDVLVMEYIKGREFTCGVLGNTGQTKLVALPPVEIVVEQGFFDYSSKYTDGLARELCPAPIDKALEARITSAAVQAHETLGCDGLTRSDFILGNDNKLYFLEINTIPGMTAQSLCPKEAAASGMSYSQLLDQIIDLAIQRRGKAANK
ncbi:MAG: D-alanine--D-alanine ligase [Candidatus Andersenbacteria bacterium]